MAAPRMRHFDKVFRNQHGQIVLWQTPNVPLWGWIASTVLGIIFKHTSLHSGLQNAGKAFLFTWSYLEIRTGESMFRRILGAIVMAGIVYGFFKPQ
jgi:hypothetical protein